MSAYKYNVPPDKFKDGMPMNNMNNQVASGLDILARTDRLIVRQKVDLLEAFTGWQENNRYVIRNSAGQQIFYAFESTDNCMRMCCGSSRGFTINVVDNLNQAVLRFSREFKCGAGCCWCAGICDFATHSVTVETPAGEVLGFIRQQTSLYKPYYDLLDSASNKVLQIEGPYCIFNGPMAPCDNEFDVQSLDGKTQVGKVCKEYSGFIQEAFTNADNFSISFPVDMSVKMKAVLLGALFLIDFMFFEQPQQQHNQHGHHYY